MISRTTLAVLILAVVALTTPSKASANITAGGLETLCTKAVENTVNGKATINNAICLGYIAGWEDGVSGTEVTLDNGRFVVYFADNVTVEQIIRVYIKYMDAHPEDENKTPTEALIGALIPAHLLRLTPIAQASQAH